MFDCVVAHDSREPSARIGNPYVAGNQVGGSSAFVGRADLLRDVRRELVTPQSRAVLLYGQRRIGKTSILHELMHSLAGTGSYCPVYFDLQDQAKRSLGDVVVDLAQRIEDALGTSVPRPAAAADAEKWFTAQFIPSVLAHIPSEAALVVLFDEFDVLADVRSDHAASSFFPYLRELLSATHGRMRFVFVIGRNIDDLTSIAKSLFKTVPAVRVSLLERPDAETLMRMSE